MLTKRDLVRIFGVVVLAEFVLRWPVRHETADKIRTKADVWVEKMVNSARSK